MEPFEMQVPTDAYYADVDSPPPDYPSPDVVIGRLSVRDQNQATSQVNKIKDHYNYWDPDLELKGLLVAHGEQLVPPWGSGFPFVECKGDIAATRYLITPNPLFACIFGNDLYASNQSVIDAINSGQMTVNYVGHGYLTLWRQWNPGYWEGVQDFTGVEIQQVNPGYFRPVIFSVSCLTGDITFKNSCMSELWMNASGGAVGVIGSTRTVYADPGMPFDKWLYKTLYGWRAGPGMMGIGYLGIVQQSAKMKIVQEYYGWYGWPYAELLYYQFLLLGDPSMWILPQGGILGLGNDKKVGKEKIRPAENCQLQPKLSLYPSPVSENMTVHITNGQPGPASLNIYDLSGRLISEQEFIANQGDTYFDVNFASLNIKSGIYIVKLSAAELSEVRRIVFAR